MEWILANWDTVLALLLLADRIAAATPEDLKVIGIPIGRWDNQLVDGAKWLLSALTRKKPGP